MIENFCSLKDTIKRMETSHTPGENICRSSDIELISRVCKDYSKLKNKKTTKFYNRDKDLSRHFTKDTT